jgi:colanic acid/amylovoran biosynthesis protein
VKLVVTGVTGLRNRGVEALVTATTRELSARLPGATFTVLTGSPEYDAARLPLRFVPDPRHRRIVRSRLLKPVVRRLSSQWRRARDEMQGARAVIASGGDVFSSDYSGLDRHLAPLEEARGLAIPVSFVGHSIGPFRTKGEAADWTRIASAASLVYVRESLTYDYVVRSLGLPSAKVVLGADPAFLLPTLPDRLASLMELYGIVRDRPLVAVAPSQGIARFSGLDAVAHERSLVELVRLLLDEMGARVLLVPHVQELGHANDDRQLAQRLYQALGELDRIHVLSGDHSASEFKTVIARCDFVIAERMHAAIAGLSTGVPTLVVGYSIKARGILRDAFQADDDQLPLISSNELLDASAAANAVRRFWGDRTRLAAVLGEAAPKLQRSATRAFDDVAELIATRS